MQTVAGIADIGPLTFAELAHACRAKADFEWGRTSALMALIANCHRDRHRRPLRPEDFYRPQLHRRERRGNMSADSLHALKPVFMKKK